MANRLCDGGGNRDMMRWPADRQPLAPFFSSAVGTHGDGFIPCGVCSVRLSQTNWAVCPRRLLSFDSSAPSQQQRLLWNRVLQLAGFGYGDTVRVWSEISLRDSTGLNYRLDYVLRAEDRPPVIVEVMTASTSGGNKSKTEPVNDFETLTIAIYCAVSPVVDVTGGLIQTASGRASGFGMPRTKRSGCWVQAA